MAKTETKPAESETSTEATMLDELRAIDTSSIEELCTIKQEQEVLQQRLDRMENMKAEVSEGVYQRVRGDYEARYGQLEDQARPLKEQARREYAKLRNLCERQQQALEAARSDSEELEFRNQLGEFEEKEYEQRRKDSERNLAERQAELEEAEKLKVRFVEAVHSEEELEQAGDEAASPTEVEAPEPEPPADFGELELDVPGEDPVTQNQAAVAAPDEEEHTAEIMRPSSLQPPDPPQAEDVEATRAESAPTPPPPPVSEAGEEPAPPPVPGADEGEEGHTVVLRSARLVAHFNDGSTDEHVLGMSPAPIGRAPDNIIHLPDRGVSRYHAVVSRGPEGYLIRDLGSENGTFVNGERITEHQLVDGDAVLVGTIRLEYSVG